MSTSQTATLTLGRGEGMTYIGSVSAARGAVVSTMYDCDCAHCCTLDPWDERRRVNVVLMDGRTLMCASAGSFR